MKTHTIETGVELVLVTCGDCGVVFGMPKLLYQQRRRDHAGWWCPNGHSRVFSGESEAERLQRELKEARFALKLEQQAAYEEAEAHRHTRASLRATKAAHTRTKNRIHNGVCPVCKRHFTALEQHMHNQHPEYATSEEES